jgi:hypothetical protein
MKFFVANTLKQKDSINLKEDVTLRDPGTK